MWSLYSLYVESVCVYGKESNIVESVLRQLPPFYHMSRPLHQLPIYTVLGLAYQYTY
jgi:hypothetical protein